jgi:hypothetical protein
MISFLPRYYEHFLVMMQYSTRRHTCGSLSPSCYCYFLPLRGGTDGNAPGGKAGFGGTEGNAPGDKAGFGGTEGNAPGGKAVFGGTDGDAPCGKAGFGGTEGKAPGGKAGFGGTEGNAPGGKAGFGGTDGNAPGGKPVLGIVDELAATFFITGLIYVCALPITYNLVSQTGHTPWVAGLPFFKVIALAFLISLFPRHFIQ